MTVSEKTGVCIYSVIDGVDVVIVVSVMFQKVESEKIVKTVSVLIARLVGVIMDIFIDIGYDADDGGIVQVLINHCNVIHSLIVLNEVKVCEKSVVVFIVNSRVIFVITERIV